MATSPDLENRPATYDNDPTKTIVETRNLGKVYRDFWGRKKVQALKSLDLEVRRGEIFGLLGPNGSGKSTGMRLLRDAMSQQQELPEVVLSDIVADLVGKRRYLSYTDPEEWEPFFQSMASIV
jgi:ABC-type multidrug transport system ATPase subunit